MKKVVLIAAALVLAGIAGLHMAVSYYNVVAYGPIIAYGEPIDRGTHRCSVNERVITHEGKRIPVVGLSCPMEPKYSPMYMSFLRPVGKQDADIADGEEYVCRVYEHSVFWRYWFRKTYSYDGCILVGKKHRA
jgi:hypothetical protein